MVRERARLWKKSSIHCWIDRNYVDCEQTKKEN